jgi:hypothetical protein
MIQKIFYAFFCVLIVFCLLIFGFVFPFLFDDPKMQNPLVSGSVIFLICAFVYSIFFVNGKYKNSIEKKEYLNAFFYFLAFVFSVFVFVFSFGHVDLLPDLNSYGPLHGPEGTNVALSIQRPKGCAADRNRFRGHFQTAEYPGDWLEKDGKLSFECSSKSNHFLSFGYSYKKNDSSSMKTEGGKVVSIDGVDFETYTYPLKSGPINRLVKFKGYDGLDVRVMDYNSSGSLYTFDRKIDDQFYIMYSITVSEPGLMPLFLVDKKVHEYIVSITKRAD